MKKELAIVLLSVAFIIAAAPAAGAEKLFAAIDSGTEYSSDKPSDEGDTLQFVDNASGITAEVNRQVLDDSAFDALRDYYNNDTLSRWELFTKFVELKNSYINALQSLYNTNYMDPDKSKTETAMQIFYSGKETLYGLDNCSVYLYNIVQYEGLSHSELVHLDMVIPDRSRSTVITIKFTIPKDKLDATASRTVRSMLSGFRFEGLPIQADEPSVFEDKAVIEKAKLGIYPAASQKNPVYTTFESKAAGFTISLPSTYVPFIQNSIGGVFTYTSFKIDPNRIFSISSEPLQGSGMSDALTRFKVTSYGTVKMLANSTKTYGGKEYSYLSYTSSSDGLPQYYQDYYFQSGTRLYKLQLQSALAEPGDIVMEQMSKILSSFNPAGEDKSLSAEGPASSSAAEGPTPSAAAGGQTTSPATESQTSSSGADSQTATASVSFNRYLNSEEGYGFSFPKSWRLEDVSTDIAYDRMRLFIPGLSGAVDISIQESELKQIVSFVDIVKSVNGKAVTSWPNLAVNYDPPFKDRTSRLLYSDFSINGPVSTIYRLSVFIDDNGRNRLCYSVDIINGRKLYSMFITAGEYKTASGRFSDDRINSLINSVAASFRLETTPESEERRIAGETRNRKIVFVENCLRQLIDPHLSILSVDKLQPDKTFYAAVGNTGESGFYKILLDYPNRKVEVVDCILRKNILKQELDKLKYLFSGKTSVKAVQNEANMTLAIETLESSISEKVTRTYRVNAYTSGGNVVWQTVRLAKQEDYMWECENYIKALTSKDAKVYYQDRNVFTDMEPYRLKGLGYRFMAYVTSGRTSGFMILTMDPRSSIINTEGSMIPLDAVVNGIRAVYGIKYLSSRPDAVSFNTDTFVLTLRTADRKGNDSQIVQYRIRYNLDKRILEYNKIN